VEEEKSPIFKDKKVNKNLFISLGVQLKLSKSLYCNIKI
jgi:hypothetical protein